MSTAEEKAIDALIDLMADLGRIEVEARETRERIEPEADRLYNDWLKKQTTT